MADKHAAAYHGAECLYCGERYRSVWLAVRCCDSLSNDLDDDPDLIRPVN